MKAHPIIGNIKENVKDKQIKFNCIWRVKHPKKSMMIMLFVLKRLTNNYIDVWYDLTISGTLNIIRIMWKVYVLNERAALDLEIIKLIVKKIEFI